MTLLKANNLKLGYDGRCVISGLSFTVSEGDYICVVGENGSGKTTLIKGLLGLLGKYDGELIFEGGLTRSHIGYLSQQGKFSSDFPASVKEIVMSGFLNNRLFAFAYSKKEKQEADEIMKKVGIQDIALSSFSELSGGQQQRVLLARALCAAKKLILLDEPTSALDPLATADFYSIVDNLNKEGMAVIMVSHDVSSAVRHASHILHLGSDSCFFGTTHEYMYSEMGKRLLIKDCPCDECMHNHSKEAEENA
ncbi:MAG: metal ABC transporter ATP-binding protein [Ruminococcus sp.]